MSPALSSVAPLFFLSGAVALGCETAYFRWLTLLFGATHEVAGTLLGAFMAGLALGSEIGARVAPVAFAPRRAAHPLQLYALAEALVGVSSLAAPAVFACAYPLAETSNAVGRVALAFALLAIPTTAMGATLPLLVAAVVHARADLRRGIAALYSVNLAGAATGALAVGFIALPRLGLHATTRALGVAAFVVAGGACAMYAMRPPAPPASSRERDRERAPRRDRDRLAPWLAAYFGVVSFALQVSYNRVFSLLLGSSAYTFSLVVAVVLAATALGGAAELRAAVREPRERPSDVDRVFWSRVARRALLLAISVYLGTLVVYVAPFHLAWAAGHFTSMAWVRAGLVAAVVAVPSYQVGALFPALASRFPTSEIGRAAGRAVLASTLGNIAGALGAAFVAIPLLGVQATLVFASAATLLPALVAAARAGAIELAGMATACALAASLGAILRPAWDAVGLSAGSYRVALYREQRRAASAECAPGRRFEDNRVLFARDGPIGTVVVLGHAGGPDCSLYSLRVNGKAEGSVFVRAPLAARVAPDAELLPKGDLPSEILAGALPALAGAEPARAFVVGWGTGISARALLEAGAGELFAAEIEPAVIDAAKLFDEAVQRDPRVHIAVDDARMVLRRAPPDSFDVVVSHPSNPWVASASALFSREYFALVRDRLRDGGRVLTWVQLYEIDRDAARSLVATFLEAFPDAHAFRASPTSRDVFLLGIKSPAPTTRAAIDARMAARLAPPAQRQLARAGFLDTHAVMRTYVGGEALRAYAGGAPVETDERAAVEFRVADHVLRGTAETPGEILRGLTPD